MKKLVVINVTDDSIGIENKPDDLTIEVRDYRSEHVILDSGAVYDAHGRPHIPHRFEADPS